MECKLQNADGKGLDATLHITKNRGTGNLTYRFKHGKHGFSEEINERDKIDGVQPTFTPRDVDASRDIPRKAYKIVLNKRQCMNMMQAQSYIRTWPSLQ